jgi:LCP family protein required for cell wall assembly
MSKIQRSIDGFVIRKPEMVNPANQLVPAQERVVTESPQQFLAAQSSDPLLQATEVLKHKNPRFRRVIVWATALPIVTILAIGGWVAFTAYHTSGTLFKGNIVAALVNPNKSLKVDQYGNTNILLLGTSESDPNHPGAQLTDSMMMASVNSATHKVFLLSIPRDLWVKYDKPCSAGYAGKINAVYECNLGMKYNGLNTIQLDEAAAETDTASKVGNVLGTNIQYVVHMNLAVVQKVVDAVGGINVMVNSPDPRGILDRNFDWRCNYKCYLVKYPNGPAHLTGTNAMWFVQARNDSGGYGLPRSNFDREANQRQVVTATKDKAMSVGFLANPLNIVNLLNVLGDNLHTTIDSSEIKSFIDIAKNTSNSNITSIDIQEDGANVLTTGVGPDGSDIVRPFAGLLDYTSLQAFTKQLLAGNAPLIAEQATVSVLNQGNQKRAAQALVDLLTQNDITKVVNSGSTNVDSISATTIYDLSNGKKPETLSKLKSLLNTKSVKTSIPKSILASGDFIVVIGKGSVANTTN